MFVELQELPDTEYFDTLVRFGNSIVMQMYLNMVCSTESVFCTDIFVHFVNQTTSSFMPLQIENAFVIEKYWQRSVFLAGHQSKMFFSFHFWWGFVEIIKWINLYFQKPQLVRNVRLKKTFPKIKSICCLKAFLFLKCKNRNGLKF